MPKGSPELTAERREEIISACEKLYQTMSFKEMTIIEIGKVTSFTRTSIYNYFNTKEEIFLAMLQKEYEIWIEEIEQIIEENEKLTKNKFADLLSQTLEHRSQLLKLMSMNHFDMEENSREENLIEFKKVYGKSLKAVGRCLDKFFPNLTKQEKEHFLYAFFPFVYGIYPYAVVTEKQKRAMEKAEVKFKHHTIYELSYNCILKLMG